MAETRIDIKSLKEIPPFAGVQAEADKTLSDGRRFLLIIYAAYSTMGLLASEHNGIAILDLDRKQVLCDEIARQDFGTAGATPEQLKAFGQLLEMEDEAFRQFVNSHPRHRHEI